MENRKCWVHKRVFANRGFSPLTPAWCHTYIGPSHPLFIDQRAGSVFLTRHRLYQLITIQSQCLDVCISKECDERGISGVNAFGQSHVNPAAPPLHCGSVGREHPHRPIHAYSEILDKKKSLFADCFVPLVCIHYTELAENNISRISSLKRTKDLQLWLE